MDVDVLLNCLLLFVDIKTDEPMSNDTHFRRANLNKQQQQKKEEEKKKRKSLKGKFIDLNSTFASICPVVISIFLFYFFFPFFNEAASHQTLVADGTVSVRRQ